MSRKSVSGGDFTFTGYSARTPAFCNKCIQSLLSCVPTPNFPFPGCIPLIAVGKSPIGSLNDALSWIQCTVGSFWKQLGLELHINLCIYGVFNDCLLPRLGKLRKRNLENSVLEAMYPILQSIGLGVEVLGDELWRLKVVVTGVAACISEAGVLISASELAAILAAPHPSGTTTEIVIELMERLNNTINVWSSGQFEPGGGFH